MSLGYRLTYAPIATLRADIGTAAEPRGLLQWLGPAVPFLICRDAPQPSHASRSSRLIPPTPQFPAIAAGTYDQYLQTYADSVRDFGHAVVIGFGHEMNAPWYSWGYGHVKPSDLRGRMAAHRQCFPRRRRGQRHWLWTVNADTPGSGPIAEWWPGKSYVTWVGIDGYYTSPKDTFGSVFGRTIRQVRKITKDPILLSETAVAPSADRSAEIPDLFNGPAKYKTLGLVWFDMPSDHGVLNQDWRIEGNQPAENCFQFQRGPPGAGQSHQVSASRRPSEMISSETFHGPHAEMLAQRVEDRDLAQHQHVRGAARLIHSARSISGNSWTCPEPRGHSMVKVLLRKPDRSRSPSTA